MAELTPVPLGIRAYGPRSPAVRIELSENLYPELSPDQSKGQAALLGTPGLKLFSTVGDGPIRGMVKADGLLYIVSGDRLFTVSTSGSAASIPGTIGGTGLVSMIANRTQVGIATNGPAYAVDGVTVTVLPESNLNGAAYQDGFGIFTQKNTENFFITGVDDMTTISALDFTQADALPDNVKGVISDHREVWVFGEETIEVFTNTGDPVFPFQRAGAGFIEHGTVSGTSIAKAENRVMWVGEDLRVYSAAGYTPQAISTPAVEFELNSEGSPQEAQAFTYSQEGHTFYVLNLPSTTLVYDLTTGWWHKRKSDLESRWRINTHVKVYGKNIVGDFKSGNIYELDLNTYDENGAVLRRRTQSPPLYQGDKRILMDQFVLDVQHGVGLNSGQGDNPQAMLDWTDDYGHTYSNEQWRSLGKIGEYRRQAQWYGLGSFRNRAYRITISDPVPVAILGGYSRLEVLDR